MQEGDVLEIEPIAYLRTKGMEEGRGTVVFESWYRDPDAIRGIETFSHLWLIWLDPDAALPDADSLNPSGFGLSVVALEGIEKTKGRGHVLNVSGACLPDKTPIFDIKPYLPYADCHVKEDSSQEGFLC